MNLRPQRRECPRFINLTSLIDVVFNLLLFFMVTTSFSQKTELSLELPSATSGKAAVEETTIEVMIDAQGHYAIKGTALPNQEPATLRAALQAAALATHQQEPLLVISADGQSPHQAVVTVMDAAQGLGLTHLSFATQRAASPPAPQAPDRKAQP